MHSNHVNGNWCFVWSNENQDCSERTYTANIFTEIHGYVSQSSGNFCCFFVFFVKVGGGAEEIGGSSSQPPPNDFIDLSPPHYRILPFPPTCGFGLEFQPAVLSEGLEKSAGWWGWVSCRNRRNTQRTNAQYPKNLGWLKATDISDPNKDTKHDNTTWLFLRKNKVVVFFLSAFGRVLLYRFFYWVLSGGYWMLGIPMPSHWQSGKKVWVLGIGYLVLGIE